MKRHLAILFFTSLLVSLIIFCSKNNKATETSDTVVDAARPDYGGTLIRALSGEPVSLQPLYGYSDGAACEVVIHLFPPLVRILEDSRHPGNPILTPVLAEKWEFSDNGKELTFKLNENVRWEDGIELTTDDVLFTYKKAIDPNTKTIVHYAFNKIDTVMALDKYRFKVVYTEPYVYAVYRWDIGLLPKHVLEGKEINTDEFNRKPIGYGMFRFKEWISNEQIVLEANENNFWGRPFLDRMIFRIIPEAAVQIMELKAGNLDLVSRLHTTQYVRDLVGAEVDLFINKFEYIDTYMYGLVFNLKHPLFQDMEIRHAINYGIDRQSILKGVQYDMGRECWGPVPPESWAYNASIKKYLFNPGKAKQLLYEVGWRDSDNDGILDKNGLPLEFTMLSHQNEAVQQLVTIVQQQLKQIGIRMKIKVVEWSVYLNTFVAKRNFDMCVTRGTESVLTPDLSFEFHSSQIHDTEYNWATYINPELDQLIENSVATFDQEKQKQYLYKAQEIISEDVPVIYLFMRNSMVATNKRVQGPKPLISPLGFDYNLDWWWIPKQLQDK